jgi:hypothetical protein
VLLLIFKKYNMDDIRIGAQYLLVTIAAISYALYFPTLVFKYLRKKYSIENKKIYIFITLVVWIFINILTFATW